MLKDRRRVQQKKDHHQVNEQIGYARMQVITEAGENLGIMSRFEALSKAREEGLDLVLLADRGSEGVPIVKIMDFGKMLYAKKKKLADAKKKQRIIKVKEVKLRPKIDEHDYQTKMKRAIEFLHDGNRVKFTLMFRGREMATKEERGRRMFDKIDATLTEKGIENLEREKDMTLGTFWSRVYYIKNNK